ncbi:hypothetical protein ACFYUV_22460 [Nonomuraea sp. NPDC003560]|uniref:hypothetical protein n=1 Tax=Nonomuraea sp. NPDC003560 TaxID=3364341 RepID=UPI0036B8F197
MTGPGATAYTRADADADAKAEAETLAELVRACPGVAGLSGGPFGTVATYLPGARVMGVSADGDTVEIAIVATLVRPLSETAEDVRQAVWEPGGGRPVNVHIDDVVIDVVEES